MQYQLYSLTCATTGEATPAGWARRAAREFDSTYVSNLGNPAVMYVFALLGLILYVWAIVCVQVIGTKDFVT